MGLNLGKITSKNSCSLASLTQAREEFNSHGGDSQWLDGLDISDFNSDGNNTDSRRFPSSLSLSLVRVRGATGGLGLNLTKKSSTARAW